MEAICRKREINKKTRKKNTSIMKFNKQSEIIIQDVSKLVLDNTEFKLVRTLGSNGGLIGSIIQSKTMIKKTDDQKNMGFTPVSDLVIIDDEKKIVASAGEDNIIYIWDLNEASLLNKFEVGDIEYVFCLAALDNSSLAVGSSDETVGIWDIETGKVRLELKGHTGGTRSLCVLNDRLICGSLKTFFIWNTKTGELVKTIDRSDKIGDYFRLSMMIYNNQIVAAPYATRWDLLTGENMGRFLDDFKGIEHSEIGGLFLYYNEQMFVEVERDTHNIHVHHLEQNRQCTSFSIYVGSGVLAIAVLSDGRIVSGDEDCSVKIWNSKTGELMNALKGHNHEVWSLAVLKDDSIVSGSSDGEIKLWKANFL